MDKTYCNPVNIDIDAHPDVKVEAIRNLYFSNMKVRGPQFLWINGRKENHIEKVEFNNCSFTQTDGTEFPERESHGATRHGMNRSEDYNPMNISYADNIRFNNTTFSVKKGE